MVSYISLFSDRKGNICCSYHIYIAFYIHYISILKFPVSSMAIHLNFSLFGFPLLNRNGSSCRTLSIAPYICYAPTLSFCCSSMSIFTSTPSSLSAFSYSVCRVVLIRFLSNIYYALGNYKTKAPKEKGTQQTTASDCSMEGELWWFHLRKKGLLFAEFWIA